MALIKFRTEFKISTLHQEYSFACLAVLQILAHFTDSCYCLRKFFGVVFNRRLK